MGEYGSFTQILHSRSIAWEARESTLKGDIAEINYYQTHPHILHYSANYPYRYVNWRLLYKSRLNTLFPVTRIEGVKMYKSIWTTFDILNAESKWIN